MVCAPLDGAGFDEATYYGRVSHNLVAHDGQALERLERWVGRFDADGRLDGVRELRRIRRREDHARPRGVHVLEGAGRVRVDYVAVGPVDLADDPVDLRVRAARRREGVPVEVREAVNALVPDLRHHGAHAVPVPAQAVV